MHGFEFLRVRAGAGGAGPEHLGDAAEIVHQGERARGRDDSGPTRMTADSGGRGIGPKGTIREIVAVGCAVGISVIVRVETPGMVGLVCAVAATDVSSVSPWVARGRGVLIDGGIMLRTPVCRRRGGANTLKSLQEVMLALGSGRNGGRGEASMRRRRNVVVEIRIELLVGRGCGQRSDG
jgi:hypothetical protein